MLSSPLCKLHKERFVDGPTYNLEEGQDPFPKREGQRSLGVSQRKEERSALAKGMRIPELSLAGYIDSHFKMPHEKFAAFDPWTPKMDQETIDYRAEQQVYHNIDLSLAGIAFGYGVYVHGLAEATQSLHFYRLGQAVRTSPLVVGAYALVTAVALQTAAMQEFSATEQLQVLSGVSTPSSSKKHKLMSLSKL